MKKGTRKFFLFELLGTRKSQKGTRKFPYPFQKGEQIYKTGKIYKKGNFFSDQRKVQNCAEIQFFPETHRIFTIVCFHMHEYRTD